MAKAKAPPKRVKRSARPNSVDYMDIDGGRRDRNGRAARLYVRIETRDGDKFVSLGLAPEKLQIRVTAGALREILKRVG